MESTAVGVPIPSLATMFSITYNHPQPQFCSILFQKQNRLVEVVSGFGTGRTMLQWLPGEASTRGKWVSHASCNLRSVLNGGFCDYKVSPELLPGATDAADLGFSYIVDRLQPSVPCLIGARSSAGIKLSRLTPVEVRVPPAL